MRTTTLLGNLASVVLTSAVGGLATRPAVQSTWYRKLGKPRYQPPRWVFPVIWPALYADIAAVSSSTIDQLRNRQENRAARTFVVALGINLVLNAGWSWLFFNRRWLAVAVAANVALTTSSADLTRRAIGAVGLRAAPLALYPLWCAFVTQLSLHIWMINRRKRFERSDA